MTGLARKLLDKLVEWALGQAKEQLSIGKRVAKKFFWLGLIVGGLVGACVGGFLTWLVLS